MSGRIMTIEEIREEFEYYPGEYDGCGICAIVSVTDMGFSRDGVTRWYTFNDADGNPAVYYKY